MPTYCEALARENKGNVLAAAPGLLLFGAHDFTPWRFEALVKRARPRDVYSVVSGRTWRPS